MRVALIAVVVGNKVLCMKRSLVNPVAPNMWELPGGKVYSIETSKEAALRELKEETGIELNQLDSLGYLTKRRNPTVETIELFITRLQEVPYIKLRQEEHEAYQFLDLDDVVLDDQWLVTMDEALDKINKWRNENGNTTY